MNETDSGGHPPTYSAAEIGALAHLYRGEMYRSTVWRTRLDTTSNWAVVTTGIALSVTFSNVQATPLPIVLISFLLASFLLFEARRYQYFDIWNMRLRVMESCFYEPMLRGKPVTIDNDWNEALADEIKRLRFHISLFEAVGFRLRRNYGWIFAIQVISYWSKIAVHPIPLASFDELWERTAVGPVSGQMVLTIGTFFYITMVAIGVMTYNNESVVRYDPTLNEQSDRVRRLGGVERY